MGGDGLRPDARLGVDEMIEERDVVVFGADELVGTPAVVEVVELDDLGHSVSSAGGSCAIASW